MALHHHSSPQLRTQPSARGSVQIAADHAAQTPGTRQCSKRCCTRLQLSNCLQVCACTTLAVSESGYARWRRLHVKVIGCLASSCKRTTPSSPQTGSSIAGQDHCMLGMQRPLHAGTPRNTCVTACETIHAAHRAVIVWAVKGAAGGAACACACQLLAAGVQCGYEPHCMM